MNCSLTIYDLVSKHRKKIMGVAAFAILFCHSWKLLFLAVPLLCEIEYFVRKVGYVGVDIFFFLSGVGLPQSYENSKSTLEFYLKRIKRIVIPYAIANVAYALNDPDGSLIKYFVSLINLNLYTGSKYDAYLWFLPAIITMYLIFPFIYKVFNRVKNKYALVIGTIVVWGIIIYFGQNLVIPSAYRFLNRIPVFLLGIIFRWEGKNKKVYLDIKKLVFLALALIAGFLGIYIIEFKGLYSLTPFYEEFIPCLLVAISLTVLLAYFFNLLKDKNIISKVFSFYGGITLELYLVQIVFEKLVQDQMSEVMPAVIVNISFFSLTTLISYLLAKTNTCLLKKIDNK